MSARIALLLTPLLATLGGCASPGNGCSPTTATAPAAPTNGKLEGSWLLQSATAINEKIPQGITMTISDNPDAVQGKFHIVGYSGVNYYVGNANLDPSQQRFILSTDLNDTKQQGPKDSMQFEQDYLNQLDAVVTYSQSGPQSLTLRTMAGAKLQFQKQAD